MYRRVIGRLGLCAVASAWGAAVVAGFAALLGHAAEPGDPGTPPSSRPGAMPEVDPGSRTRLLLFAHPRCPCTAASLAELARILARCGGRLDADVLFYRPEDAPESWAKTGLRREAGAIPGVRAVDDPGGREAARHGVVTSGHALLFGPDGARLFSGGITAARGHEGSNDGAESVVRLAVAADAAAALPSHPVFGCRIREPGGDR